MQVRSVNKVPVIVSLEQCILLKSLVYFCFQKCSCLRASLPGQAAEWLCLAERAGWSVVFAHVPVSLQSPCRAISWRNILLSSWEAWLLRAVRDENLFLTCVVSRTLWGWVLNSFQQPAENVESSGTTGISACSYVELSTASAPKQTSFWRIMPPWKH